MQKFSLNIKLHNTTFITYRFGLSGHTKTNDQDQSLPIRTPRNDETATQADFFYYFEVFRTSDEIRSTSC